MLTIVIAVVGTGIYLALRDISDDIRGIRVALERPKHGEAPPPQGDE